MNTLRFIYICLSIYLIDCIFAEKATFKVNQKSEFSKTAFIFQRGENFSVEIYSENFKEAFDKSQNGSRPTINIFSVLETSDLPLQSTRSLFRKSYFWNINSLTINGPFVDFTVQVPVNTSVGLWNVTIELRNNDSILDDITFRTFVIFCAKCSDDYVYMSQQWERDLYLNQEYEVAFSPLLNQKFLIYKQTSQLVLQAVNALMRNASISETGRSMPTAVLLAMMKRIQEAYNIMDEKISDDKTKTEKGDFIDWLAKNLKELLKKLFGRFDSKNSKGMTKPIILQELDIEDFFLNVKNMKSVLQKAGEKEWFLSSLLVAISRTLGIPARLVTVINANAGLRNKIIVDYKGLRNLRQLEQSLYTDYDLWIEIWTTKLDDSLPKSGWQVLDFGIDETGHMSILGPVSVESIRNNHTIDDSSKYFLSAIYGDEQQYLDTKYRISRDHHCNQVKIITSYNRLKHGNQSPSVFADITGNYKNPNGNCSQTNKSTLLISSKTEDDLTLRIIENSATRIGNTFRCTLQMENTCRCKNSDFVVKVTVRSVGIKQDNENIIDSYKFEMKFRGAEIYKHPIEVKPEKYLPKLNGIAALRIDVVIRDKKSDELYALYYDNKLGLPEVIAQQVEYTGENALLKISFDNPINETIENSQLIIDGIDFRKVEIKLNPIKALEHWQQTIPMNLTLIYRYILASFKTKYFQIPDINLILNF